MACFSGPSIVIVTGANRGYGYQLAVEAVKHVANGSSVVLVGRSADGLKVAQEKISTQAGEKKVEVKCVVADLSLLEQVSTAAEQIMAGHNLKQFKSLFLFNNAASLGDVTKTFDSLTSVREVLSYFNLNVNACLLLTSHILQKTKQFNSLRSFVVNISSLLALEAKAGCSLYCTGKAARDMMFKVLAAERPDLRVLNWAPGPMPTKMFDELLLNNNDPDLVDSLKKMVEDKTIIKCSDSANKLMKLLIDDKFKSGTHIDYFDV